MAKLSRMHLRNALAAGCLFPWLPCEWSVTPVDTGFIFMHKCFRTIAHADQREEKMGLANILPKTLTRSNCWDGEPAFWGTNRIGMEFPRFPLQPYTAFSIFFFQFSSLIRGFTVIFLNMKCLSCFTICVTVGLQKHAGECSELAKEKRLCWEMS